MEFLGVLRVSSHHHHHCEKVARSHIVVCSLLQSEGKMVTEALYINKSLSFLEQVVIALADKHREHIPFRQSKLTHYLKDSIGGHCNTVLIANVWGERGQLEETVSLITMLSKLVFII